MGAAATRGSQDPEGAATVAGQHEKGLGGFADQICIQNNSMSPLLGLGGSQTRDRASI